MASKHHISSLIAPKAKITAAEFAAKFNSKREVYRFLASECHCYLPGYESVTIWHLKDLVAKKKHAIKCTDVKVINVPQFEGLTIDDMMAFGKIQPDVMRSLPPEKEIEKLPRQYIANIIYTMVGKPFSTWVDSQIKKRNEKILIAQNLLIEMDPEIAEIFQASTSMSGKCQQQPFFLCLLITLSGVQCPRAPPPTSSRSARSDADRKSKSRRRRSRRRCTSWRWSRSCSSTTQCRRS